MLHFKLDPKPQSARSGLSTLLEEGEERVCIGEVGHDSCGSLIEQLLLRLSRRSADQRDPKRMGRVNIPGTIADRDYFGR